MVSNLTGNTALFRPQDDEVIECFNNIATVAGTLQINAVTNGTVTYYYNWLQTGYSGTGAINGGNNITGTAPGFVDAGNEDYHLTVGSACRDAGMALPAACSSHPVSLQYVKHQDVRDASVRRHARHRRLRVRQRRHRRPRNHHDEPAEGRVGTAYSQTLAATGGVTPYSWSLYSGSLPGGLSLSSGGVISGTPTTARTSNFTVQVADSQGPADTDTQALSITVYADLNITTTSLPSGRRNQAYSQTLAATGGKTPYAWSVVSGSLPAACRSTRQRATISGTPRKTGTSNFTVRCTDSQSPADTDDQALSIVITT